MNGLAYGNPTSGPGSAGVLAGLKRPGRAGSMSGYDAPVTSLRLTDWVAGASNLTYENLHINLCTQTLDLSACWRPGRCWV
jgi:hypothetical protein